MKAQIRTVLKRRLSQFSKQSLLMFYVLILVSHFSWAQTVYPETMPQRGVYPNGVYSFDKSESINKLNGVLTYTIPLTTMPLGRAGMSIPINLVYSSALYDYAYSVQQNTPTQQQITANIIPSP